MPKILCVEDNEDNFFVLHRRLGRAGFEVKVATNGALGVDWAKTLLPDLIVMDLNLPEMDGWEATRRLKNQPETKHIPIVVLSANTGVRHRERAFAAGCDAFETKPTDFDRLLEVIRSLVGKGAEA